MKKRNYKTVVAAMLSAAMVFSGMQVPILAGEAAENGLATEEVFEETVQDGAVLAENVQDEKECSDTAGTKEECFDGEPLPATVSGNGWTYDNGTKTLTIKSDDAYAYKENVGIAEWAPKYIFEWYDYVYEIENLVLEDGVTTIDTRCETYDDWIVEYAHLKNVVAASSVKSVADYGLSNCPALETICLPEVETLGEYALALCTHLKDVELPKVKTVGSDAFENCISLESIELPLAESVEGFNDCSALKTVELSKAKTVKGFSYCTSLRSLIMPIAVNVNGGFSHCTSLKNVELPCVKYIRGEAVFKGCTSLEEIDLKSVEEMEGAFWDCTSLKKVSLPNLKKVTDCFGGCSSLESISLPIGMSIGDDLVLGGCGSLSLVEFGGTKEEFEDLSIKMGIPAGVKIKCSNGEIIWTRSSSGDFGGGDKIKWSFDKERTLTVSGQGEIQYSGGVDFVVARTLAKRVVVSEGITTLGDDGQLNCKCEELVIPQSINSVYIGKGEFPLLNTIIYNGSINEWKALASEYVPYNVLIKCSDGDLFATIPKATEVEIWENGERKESDIVWSFYGDTVTVSGNGTLDDASGSHCFYNLLPKVVQNSARKLVIGEGITSVGQIIINDDVTNLIEDLRLPDTCGELGNNFGEFWPQEPFRMNIPRNMTKVNQIGNVQTIVLHDNFYDSLGKEVKNLDSWYLLNVEFDGTMAQWNAILEADKDNHYIPGRMLLARVQCKDGVINDTPVEEYELTVSAGEGVNTDLKSGKFEAGKNITFKATLKKGYKDLVVKVKEGEKDAQILNASADGSYSIDMPAEEVTVTISATKINSGTTEPTDPTGPTNPQKGPGSEKSVSYNVLPVQKVGNVEMQIKTVKAVEYIGKQTPVTSVIVNGQSLKVKDEVKDAAGNPTGIILKKISCKNNKKTGDAKLVLTFALSKKAKSLYSSDQLKEMKKIIKQMNKDYKKNPIIYKIEKRDLSKLDASGAKLTGNMIYRSKKGKWTSKLKLVVGTSKGVSVKYNKKESKTCFFVDPNYDGTAATVTITGTGNYTGSVSVPVTVK